MSKTPILAIRHLNKKIGKREILKDISFEAHPGEITAIIGGTGRGKSSILKLIPRLYDPLFGEVLIDGVNAKEYAVDDLRSLIGYVPQKNVLFSEIGRAHV